MILHLPHASLKIPKFAKHSFVVDKQETKRIKTFFADIHTNWLFQGDKKIVAKYNRIALDVERFADGDKEPMAKLGMGLVYTHTWDKQEFSKPTQNHVEEATKEYCKHHAKLDRAVDKELSKFKKCLILDCHSFSGKMVESIFGYKNCPDICIGFDEDFCPEKIVEFAEKYFSKLGYKVAKNYPYSGSLVPNAAYERKDKRVKSIMLEINKNLYIDSSNKKKPSAKELKRQIKGFVKEANEMFYGEQK